MFHRTRLNSRLPRQKLLGSSLSRHSSTILAGAGDVPLVSFRAALLLQTMHTGPRSNSRVGQKLPNHPAPAGMEIQRLIKLRSNLSELVQPRLRDLREIVMLVMVTHIVRNGIQGAIVAIRLLTLFKHIVLGNQVPSQRVDTASQNGASKQVRKGFESQEVEHQGVGGHDCDPVDDVAHVGGFGAHHQRADAVNNEVHEAVDDLRDEALDVGGLKDSGKIYITAIYTLQL